MTGKRNFFAAAIMPACEWATKQTKECRAQHSLLPPYKTVLLFNYFILIGLLLDYSMPCYTFSPLIFIMATNIVLMHSRIVKYYIRYT